MKNKSFYITTTLPYVNAPLHMGHALEFVRADVIARYKKLIGDDIYFNTGTDEHGLKIFEKAKEQNKTPQEFVNEGFEIFKEQLRMFGVLDDVHFIRTTDKHHEKAAQEFWKRVQDNGYIYKKDYESKYCVGCESEKTDSELINDECPEHPAIPLTIISEENYFFKYSLFGDKLLEFYEKNPKFIIPEFRFNEIKNFVKNGLQDFSISRLKTKMPWGIPVPGDENQVMYVWFDALVNYISTLGWPLALARDLRPEDNLFEKYWVNGTPTQYCGKDNTRFQGAMWQAMLIAADIPNSHQIIVDGFITGEGGIRMSKTLGNVVDPRDIVNEYGTDALRYFLLREVSSFEDSSFTLERFKDAYNSGLANGLGNLVSRTMQMVVSYNIDISNIDKNSTIDKFPGVTDSIERFDLNQAISQPFYTINELDKFIQEEEPFKKIKIEAESERARNVIFTVVQGLWNIATQLEPFMPETSERVRNIIKDNKKPDQPLFLRK